MISTKRNACDYNIYLKTRLSRDEAGGEPTVDCPDIAVGTGPTREHWSRIQSDVDPAKSASGPAAQLISCSFANLSASGSQPGTLRENGQV